VASSALFGVSPLDSLALVLTALVVAITSLAAALVPAMSAGRADATRLLQDN
jgi:multisubunit Na+/H+ antiporter MnhC subunit